MSKGECLCCGQCCSSFYIQLSFEELLERAKADEAKGLSMLESDAIFVSRYCIRLSPQEAQRRSPAVIKSPNWPQGEFWTCRFYRSDKLCQLDVEGLPKSHMCKGYPWYGNEPYQKWLYPGCGYQKDLENLINKEEVRMSMNLNEVEIGVAEVVDYLKMTGGFSEALKEVVKRKLTLEETRKRGITNSEDELQRAADVFRSVNNLYTAADTDQWLKERGITLEVLEDYLDANLCIFKLKEELEKEVDKEKCSSLPAVKDAVREFAYQQWLTQLFK